MVKPEGNILYRVLLTSYVAVMLLLTGLLVPFTARAVDNGWPRELQAKKAKIIIYQPQLESFKGDKVTARAAVSVQTQEMKQPVFGVVWFGSRIATDRDTRTVEFLDIKAEKMKFPNATLEQEKKLASFLEEEIAKWPHTMAFDRLLAMSEALEKEKAASVQLDNQPPVILFRTEPAVLVLIEGKPILHDLEGGKVKRVVNTPFVLLFDPSDQKYFLLGDDLWFAATDVMGPWSTMPSPPAAVAEAAKKIAETEVPTQLQPEAEQSQNVPEIIVATQPTALIVSEGEPQFAPLAGTDLLDMTNTGSDVFMPVGTNEYYALLSGRWFRSPSLTQGPWTYVAPDQLPAAFYKIPPGSDKQHVLAFVAGTPQAEDAVADAQMPQTAAVPRSQTIEVAYDGKPEFAAIEGTQMQYGVNTDKQVVKVGDAYYAVDNAVWYTSNLPQGPWQVVESVPPEIQDIPPSSPVYNIKYVQVYQATPDVVYMGYTPGYTGTYVDQGTVVYGTGYVYPAYVSPRVYYPAPVTYGFAPAYNPYYGAWSFMAGATFGFVAGAATANWWGCSGWRGDVNVDINRNININNANWRNTSIDRSQARNNIYKRPDNWRNNLQETRRNDFQQRAQRREGSQGRLAGRQGQQPAREARLKEGQGAKRAQAETRRTERKPGTQQRAGTREARKQERPAGQKLQGRQQAGTRDAQRAASREMKKNNVYAGRDGNVYRKQDKNWQQRDRSGWSKPSTKPQSNYERNRGSLNKDFSARSRGTERTQSFKQAQSSRGSRGSSQGSRGGGGRSGGSRGGGRRR